MPQTTKRVQCSHLACLALTGVELQQSCGVLKVNLRSRAVMLSERSIPYRRHQARSAHDPLVLLLGISMSVDSKCCFIKSVANLLWTRDANTADAQHMDNCYRKLFSSPVIRTGFKSCSQAQQNRRIHSYKDTFLFCSTFSSILFFC